MEDSNKNKKTIKHNRIDIISILVWVGAYGLIEALIYPFIKNNYTYGILVYASMIIIAILWQYNEK
jgi:hypothetical protein